MYKLLLCLKCLSLKSATTLLQFMMFAVVIALCSIVLEVNASFMDALISEISDRLLFKQNFIQYESQTNLLKYQANWPMIKRYKMMSTFSDIYLNFLPKIQIQQFKEPLQCPVYKGQYFKSFETLLNLPQSCITNLKTYEEDEFYSFLNIMDQLIIPLTYQPITEYYFTNTQENHFFTSIPPIFDFPDYKPNERPWYINHLNQTKFSNRKGFISNIYQSYGNQDYSFTLTYSLYSNKINNTNQQKIVAIMGYDSSFDEYSQQFQFKSLAYFILNTEGQIVLTNQFKDQNLNFSKNIYSFYESNLTGFNSQDWIQVQNQALSINYTNNCQIQLIHLCRYNTKYKEDIILHVFNLNSDFYLVIFQNITEQQNNIKFAEDLKMNIIRSFGRQLLYMISVSLTLLIITWIGMYIYFRPIKYLRKLLLQQINNKFFSSNNIQQFQPYIDENRSSYLKQALKTLKTKITDINHKKSLNCYLIENFKYPLNIKPLNIQKIIEQAKLIDNNENNEQQFEDNQNNQVASRNIEIFQQIIHQRTITNNTLFSETDENAQLFSDPGTSRQI